MATHDFTTNTAKQRISNNLNSTTISNKINNKLTSSYGALYFGSALAGIARVLIGKDKSEIR